nr:uncharacterized mitochondrial protein AtMg00810-like [Tanacetum cinerariifolium]
MMSKNLEEHRKMKEEVYVCQPPQFEDPNFSDIVYKVKKALYGLHQALRAWNETLSTYLLNSEFLRGKIDKTLFIKRHKGDILLVQVYVDDIIFGLTKKELYNAFERLMHEKFQMSSMGELTFFLRLQVKQKNDGIFVSQDKYVAEILKKLIFTEVKTTSTPMETQKPLLKDEDGEEADVHMYRSMIGSLMYLTSSRPDIMFAVCACTRYQVNLKVSHLYAVKRIFRKSKEMCKINDGKAVWNRNGVNTVGSKSMLLGIHLLLLFWSTAMAKTINREAQLHAHVDGKKIIITEASIRRDLQLADEEDEAVHKELGDSLVRAATITSSLEAEQDSGNINKTQSKATPNEHSSQGTNSGGGLRCQETMGILLPKLGLRVYLNIPIIHCLQEKKTSQRNEIDSLKIRVKKLEKRNKSRTHKVKRLYKVGFTASIESSGDKESLEVVNAAQDSTTTTTITTEEITLAQALKALKTSKPKMELVLLKNFNEKYTKYLLLLVEVKTVGIKVTTASGSYDCQYKVNAAEEVNIAGENILNHLGKFDGKADEGFFVRYSLNNKAFRVFNSRTRIVEENLHIRFSEITPHVVGSGPDWLFDIDALTRTKNYELIVAGTQSNGFAGTKASDNAGQARNETELSKITFCYHYGLLIYHFPKIQRVLMMMDPNLQVMMKRSSIVNAAGTNKDNELPFDPNMHDLEDVSIFNFSNDDGDDGIEADMNNLDTTIQVSHIPTTRIHKDHSLDQVIRYLHSATQTRMMSNNLEEHGFVSTIQQRTNHKDLQNCLFACFLSQEEPKKAIGTKWVVRNKKDEKGIAIRNKARLVAQRKIEEEVYVCQPPRLKDPNFPDRIYKVKKNCMDYIKLLELDMKPSKNELMHEKFQMSSMRELTFLLRLQVKQISDGIFISQDKHVAKILKKFRFTKVKTASTPMETQKPLLKDKDGEEVNVLLYRSMIGSLMYLTSSRPDIMIAVYVCARYQDNVKVSHLHDVKRIFRHTLTTAGSKLMLLGITYYR